MSSGRKIEKVICAGEKIVYQVGRMAERLESGDEISTSKVKEIGQHEPLGPGDCWYFLIMFEDSSQIQVFNMDRVFHSKAQSIMPVTSKLMI